MAEADERLLMAASQLREARETFKQVFEELYPQVYRCILAQLGSGLPRKEKQGLANELTQEAFGDAWRSLPQVRSHPTASIFKIARNRVCNWFRDQAKQTQTSQLPDDLTDRPVIEPELDELVSLLSTEPISPKERFNRMLDSLRLNLAVLVPLTPRPKKKNGKFTSEKQVHDDLHKLGEISNRMVKNREKFNPPCA